MEFQVQKRLEAIEKRLEALEALEAEKPKPADEAKAAKK